MSAQSTDRNPDGSLRNPVVIVRPEDQPRIPEERLRPSEGGSVIRPPRSDDWPDKTGQ